MRGCLIIISSPSGGGKGTLIRRLRKEVAGLAYSVSFTTREMREGEADGVDYNFVSDEEFERLISKDEFLEYATVHGKYYGTSRSFINNKTDQGNDVILEIDVQGAEIIKKKAPEAIGVFILPPSFDVLKARLAERNTESEDEFNLRLRNASEEVKRYKEFDYVVVNDDLEKAVADLQSVVTGNRLLRDRQEDTIRGILTTFEYH